MTLIDFRYKEFTSIVTAFAVAPTMYVYISMYRPFARFRNYYLYQKGRVGIYCLLTRNVLPEAICCCLQTCYVGVMLLLMDCMCIPTFIVVTVLVV